VRSDLVVEPVTRWADLWDPRYTGKIALWNGDQRETIGIALKALGYSVNSVKRDELEAALEKLLVLKPSVLFMDEIELITSAPVLGSGKALIALGWSVDAMEGRKINPAITYILPEEGTMLWADNFVIPINSSQKSTAELFINFLMRPEINAEIVNYNYYATANEAAFPYIDPDIINNPVIFPPNESLQNAEIILPLNPDGEKLYSEIWERFLPAQQ
jgi:spermidine/putrescine transport system substrate-binding protein